MAAIRRNILTNAQDRDRFIQAVLALKAEPAGITTGQLGIQPRAGEQHQALSTWDLFVIWHVWAMAQSSPDRQRNAAHMGPVFLPWHRWYLLVLEFEMRRVLGVGRDDFGLPYWDWAADGTALPIPDQGSSPLWTAEFVGGNGRPADDEVFTGPFRRDSAFQVVIEADRFGQLWAVNRGLRRRHGYRPQFPPNAPDEGLPDNVEVAAALTQTSYDMADWNRFADGFRNHLEGWAPTPTAPNLHNMVHVWVGGDMGPASSPNDPAFFLNHCNVDRIWSAWQAQNPNRPYVPAAGTEPAAQLFRHRRSDPLYSLLTATEPLVSQVLRPDQFYAYDTLAVA